MIIKILINGKEYGVDVSENNYMGEVEIHDTFHCAAEEDGLDTIFGTNDPMITIKIGDDNMMLKVKNAIEDIIEKYSDDHRFINDHELNVVCQIDTDEERIEFILAAIDEQLPAGIVFSHEYTCGEYEITFKEINGEEL